MENTLPSYRPFMQFAECDKHNAILAAEPGGMFEAEDGSQWEFWRKSAETGEPWYRTIEARRSQRPDVKLFVPAHELSDLQLRSWAEHGSFWDETTGDVFEFHSVDAKGVPFFKLTNFGTGHASFDDVESIEGDNEFPEIQGDDEDFDVEGVDD